MKSFPKDWPCYIRMHILTKFVWINSFQYAVLSRGTFTLLTQLWIWLHVAQELSNLLVQKQDHVNNIVLVTLITIFLLYKKCLLLDLKTVLPVVLCAIFYYNRTFVWLLLILKQLSSAYRCVFCLNKVLIFQHKVDFLRIGRLDRIHSSIQPFAAERLTDRLKTVADLTDFYNSKV